MRRIVFCSLSLILLTSDAYANGFLVGSSEGVDIQGARQKALIVIDEGIEELVLEVRFEGAVEDFAWLVPLPAAPEMRVVERETFKMLSRATRTVDMGRSRRSGFALSGESSDEVSVLERKLVGIYDIAVLAGGAGGGIVAWLAEHGFRLPAHATPVIDQYLARDWVFAAMRISPTAASEDASLGKHLADGTIQPVMFRFPSAEPVYPLKISSIMGHPAEVLLYVIAKDPLVCRNTEAVDWRNDVFGSVNLDRFQIPDHLAHHEGTNVRRDTTYYITEIAERHFTDQGGAVLTKLRATFAPEQMVDLTFESYSPIDELAADDLGRRIQAAIYLGTRPSREAVVPLLELMWGSNASLIDQEDALQYFREFRHYPDQDVTTALWALGRIGADEAVEDVTRWVQGPNPRCALEALNTLLELTPQTATEICVEILSGIRSHLVECREERAIVVLARDWLIAYGDLVSVPGLRTIVKDKYSPKSWDEYNSNVTDLGLYALVAAAACGDKTAQAELLNDMKQAAVALNVPSVRGMISNYPAAMTLGIAILHSRYGTQGAPLQVVEELLAYRPAVKESLFRKLADDQELGPRMDGVRAVMLSKLETPEDRDFSLLNEIWDRALDQPRNLRVKFRGSLAANDTVTYNVDAIAAAYALGTHGRVADLLACWQDVDWDDVDMKGELALALCLTGDPEAVPTLLEYVRTIWNHNAAMPKLTSVLGRVPLPPYGWPNGAPLDLRYRAGRIVDFIVEHAWDEVLALVADGSLHPQHRIFWALEPMPWWDYPTTRYVELLRELRSLTEVELMRKRIDWKIDQAVRTMTLLQARN